MNKLDRARRAQILTMMVEGVSIRAISRVTGASKNTIVKLLSDAGQACSEYQDRTLCNLPCKRVQVDEIWAFVSTKQKNVSAEKKGVLGVGDVWTWTGICADTKIVPSWFVGHRDQLNARAFMFDLASRMRGRIQLTGDGFRPYKDAVSDACAGEVDYAMLLKHYGQEAAGSSPEKRYSLTGCFGAETQAVAGTPDNKHVSTSYTERQSLNILMGNRRFTRLTNAFSKKMEDHVFALSIYFMHYNFARIHTSLRVTPAIAAGVSNSPWRMEDIVQVVEEREVTPADRRDVRRALRLDNASAKTEAEIAAILGWSEWKAACGLNALGAETPEIEDVVRVGGKWVEKRPGQSN